jgi:sulfur carrier protein
MSEATSGVLVVVNGEARPLSEGTTVDAVVEAVAQSRSGVAVALNGAVVPRSAWSSTLVANGDRIEVLTAAQGG